MLQQVHEHELRAALRRYVQQRLPVAAARVKVRTELLMQHSETLHVVRFHRAQRDERAVATPTAVGNVEVSSCSDAHATTAGLSGDEAERREYMAWRWQARRPRATSTRIRASSTTLHIGACDSEKRSGTNPGLERTPACCTEQRARAASGPRRCAGE
jgi:hypothetical protein